MLLVRKPGFLGSRFGAVPVVFPGHLGLLTGPVSKRTRSRTGR